MSEEHPEGGDPRPVADCGESERHPDDVLLRDAHLNEGLGHLLSDDVGASRRRQVTIENDDA